MIYIYCFLISALLVLFIMPYYIKLMLKYKVLDRSGGRKIHTGIKVNVGGLVLFISFLASYIVSLPYLSNNENIDSTITFILIIACLIVVGVRDDMNSLTAKSKLVIEIMAILFLCRMGILIDNLYGFFGIYELPLWVSYVVTIFFFVVIINTYNLIDGIDGQATTQALIILIPLFIFFLFLGNNHSEIAFHNPNFWTIICISIIGALVSFLYYNWEPSRIFMGDTGSIFIGTIIACTMVSAINFNGHNHNDFNLFGFEIKSKIGVVVSLFYIPLADTLRVFCARVLKKKSPFSPDKSHIHHFLLRTGASHKTSTLITLTFSIIISTLGLIFSLIFTDNIFIPLLVVLFILYVITISYITKRRLELMKKKLRCQKKLTQ